MECKQCRELGRLLSNAESKHADIRTREIAAIKALDEATSFDPELALSATVVEMLRSRLLSHKASHAKPLTSRATTF